ncbi:13974_t:CDS:2 [Gigaspora margarita]|uniref:13974_t:CDS:1 n=1 Tax=Gigaspora margarita TaxID=4874 RepID=A0ABN7VV64_GIGMA|nr:13974_t:CDS:2 [Gigaspora margarita]
MSVIIGVVWKISAENEWRHNKPNRWIPSMMQLQLSITKELKIIVEPESESPEQTPAIKKHKIEKAESWVFKKKHFARNTPQNKS